MSEYPFAVVIPENEHQWVIRCPYCRKRHYNGIGEGHRVAHCLQKDENNIGYDVRLPTSEGVKAWASQHQSLFTLRERKRLGLE